MKHVEAFCAHSLCAVFVRMEPGTFCYGQWHEVMKLLAEDSREMCPTCALVISVAEANGLVPLFDSDMRKFKAAVAERLGMVP